MRLYLLLAAVALTAAAPHPAPSQKFETVFATGGEPAMLHFHTDYGTGLAVHHLEVWRDRDKQLKRVTDGLVETYVAHAADGIDFRMIIVDNRKRIVTTIDRANLYRLGNFTDWFDLGHGLRHPKGAYMLGPGKAPAGAPKPFAACRWYDLVEGQRTTRICWSTEYHLPLVIAPGGGAIWRVTSIDTVVPKTAFRIVDKGYVRMNANRDIEPD
ncbi:hypothetical protein [Polymorphobacter megasporae]|uniref:hypothetical protein n=1 Tax=Glacieibacterium megasporae TaxID=2835787 RepID=UPI001C1E6E10|nr:hypothetical protein [Polymorphobacter megasporae]UAJ09540.1 hypothetical protein KTC28_14650 [Polymorphobacter megasporae]